MLGTIAELEAFYVPPKVDTASSLGGMLATVAENHSQLGSWALTDVMSLYGAPSSTQEIVSLITEADASTGAREEAAEAGQGFTPPVENPVTKIALDAKLRNAMADHSMDASNLPPAHSSWGQQKLNVADEGIHSAGRMVYIALRVGLLAQPNPFPERIAAVVVAANPESYKYGSWTPEASSAARKATVDEGEEGGTWDDNYRVYILLPRQCFLAPGTTGDVACAAYGVGWARDGKLENYVDLLSGRDEVLGSAVAMAPTGLVLMLSVATVFMVDKGSRLGLPGWSGVLSVIAQYRAHDTYSSMAATDAVLAVRFGRANFASVRDFAASTMPTVWYPLLALGAEVSGRNAAWGGCICAAAVGILLFAHGLKLKGRGIDNQQMCVKGFALAVSVVFSPLTYRVWFYTAFTTSINFTVYRLMTGSFSGIPDVRRRSTWIFYACLVVGSLVEFSVIASRHGWDPAVSTKAIRFRWIVTGLASLCGAYAMGDTIRGGNVLHDPKPYTLSGWSHRHGGSNKASRHIVEYGLGEGVRTDGDHERDNYYTIWRG